MDSDKRLSLDASFFFQEIQFANVEMSEQMTIGNDSL